MKKILFMVPWLSGYGGTETVIHNLFEMYFRNKDNINVNFELYSIGGFIKNTNLNYSNVHVIQLFKDKYLKIFKKRFIRNAVYVFVLPFIMPYLLLKTNPDVIIATNPVLWLLAKFFSKLFHKNVPVVAWYHYSYAAKHVRKFYLKWPDYYLTISKTGEKELLNKGVNRNKIFVVYDPVVPSKNIIFRSHHHNQLVYVGRIEYGKQKNIQELFKALSYIHRDWILRIYGKSVYRKDIYNLQHLSKELGISNHIKWMGFHKDVFNHINVADALLLTSNYEGFSMVIAEAISHGLYVISSNCPSGPSELVKPSNGNLYKMHDLHQLIYLINKVLDGKRCINQLESKKSISKLYVKNYFINFIKKLYLIVNRE